MRTTLTIISTKELPKHDPSKKDPIGFFDEVSIKPGACTEAFKRRLERLGVSLALWEWINFQRPWGAAGEGKRLALACIEHGATRFYVNAEKDWAEGPSPYVGMLAFVQAFRAFAPDVELYYNGFSWGVTSTGIKLHDATLIGMFDGWCPMNYGTDRRTIEKFWVTKNFKYTTARAIVPMVGVGRVDKSGKIWGFWQDRGGVKGLYSLLQMRPVDGVNFFFGNGAKERLLGEHSEHIALVDAATLIRGL